MACIICFDLSKIMRLLKFPKRPVIKRLRDLQWIKDLQITAAYILEHVEIDCGFKIWHIKPFRNSHIFKGAIF